MFDTVFFLGSIRETHRNAPLRTERESYLGYLFDIGTRRERVRAVATMLLHVVRLLELDSPRLVGVDEIARGSERWVDDPGACRHRRTAVASTNTFRLVATNWLRFQGLLIVSPKSEPGFPDLLFQFLHDMRTLRGLASETIRSYRSRIMAFLNWLEPRCPVFSDVKAQHIEEFLKMQQADGWAPSSLAALCRTLSTFFQYLERREWCSSGLQRSIFSPSIPRIASYSKSLEWEDVRRIIASIGCSKPSDLRAKAMLLLFSIYGLRSIEVRSLMLQDIDWRRELITIHRAKRGKTQQFPIQAEVGDAIVRYLEKGRSRCSCRNVFTTLNPPYRPIQGHSMSTIVGVRMKKLGIETDHFGPHAFRHACATQLLRTGTSLKEIADFLGHRDLRSVSIYARFDVRSLTNVAEFSLGGVL